MLALHRTSILPDVKCPECEATFEVEWFTDQGQPHIGTIKCKCPECGQRFGFEVNVVYSATWEI